MAVEVKICGLTRPEDAAFAATHGASRLGVIFAGGPRQLDAGRARSIVNAAAGVPVLGVFGPAPLATMLEVVDRAGLAGIQLHGDHPRGIATALRDAGLEVWRVVPIDDASDLPTLLGANAEEADAVLIEARVPGGAGGRGVVLPLELARAARVAASNTRFVLAGGLVPETVGEVIRVVRPDMVDVSSGVEISPGIKDRARLTRFLESVFAAHAAT